jgi:hypothetical protein
VDARAKKLTFKHVSYHAKQFHDVEAFEHPNQVL